MVTFGAIVTPRAQSSFDGTRLGFELNAVTKMALQEASFSGFEPYKLTGIQLSQRILGHG